MTKIVNVAIVGGGLMGREIAAALQRWPALVDHPVHPQLTAVCDINPAALGWFDQIPTVTRRVTDYVELLADDAIDVLYIAVRHDLHRQLYVDTIQAGKSLLAEKPFGIDGSAAEAIMAAIAANPQSFVRCASEFPFFPGASSRQLRTLRRPGPDHRGPCAFLHASDLDVNKPINWKRQARYCGEAGVMNDLGLHAWHVPLRLGWAPDRILGVLQDIVTERPAPNGGRERCDTWDNAVLHGWVSTDSYSFPLTTEMKRIDPGEKNTWEFEALGLDGGVRFSTKNPKRVEIFSVVDVPGGGREQVWSSLGRWQPVCVADSDRSELRVRLFRCHLQMLAAFLAEREGAWATGSVQHRGRPHACDLPRGDPIPRNWRGRTGGRMTAVHSVLVAGHLCIDITLELTDVPELVPGQLYEIGSAQLTLGGCVANTGLALAASGCRPASARGSATTRWARSPVACSPSTEWTWRTSPPQQEQRLRTASSCNCLIMTGRSGITPAPTRCLPAAR